MEQQSLRKVFAINQPSNECLFSNAGHCTTRMLLPSTFHWQLWGSKIIEAQWTEYDAEHYTVYVRVARKTIVNINTTWQFLTQRKVLKFQVQKFTISTVIRTNYRTPITPTFRVLCYGIKVPNTVLITHQESYQLRNCSFKKLRLIQH